MMGNVAQLELTAAECRKNVLRMVHAGGHGHIGGAYSCIDIVTALYFYKMRLRPEDPKWEERDMFLLSAGHKCMAQYAALAERGYFDKAILDTYGRLHSRIPGHPNMHKLPGIEANTGALGHGLSIAVGIAMGVRGNRGKDAHHSKRSVYVVLGDGELAEGSNWEAVLAAAHYGLDHLIAFVDYNGLQISGRVEEIMNLTPIEDRFKAFGWMTRTIDGNNMGEILDILDHLPVDTGKPVAVIAKTIKGKGISFLEDQRESHFWKPSMEDLKRAEQEIEDSIERRRRRCMVH